MNVHKNARLTVFGRERLVRQVLERVLTPAAAAAAAGVSVRTAYKLLARYGKEGVAGLCDRGSGPKRMRCALSARQRELIERLRRERRPYREIAKQVKASLSTVARYAQRLGLNRLAILDPKPPVQRYEHDHPGELVHLDTKRLVRYRQSLARVFALCSQSSPWPSTPQISSGAVIVLPNDCTALRHAYNPLNHRRHCALVQRGLSAAIAAAAGSNVCEARINAIR
jgi:transposase